MGVFKAAFINEIEKMYRKKKAVVVVILSLLVIVMGQIAVIGIQKGFGISASGGANFPFHVLSFFASTLLPLFTALVIVDCFTGEFSHNTIKISLLRPISRIKLFCAKVTAAAFFILMNLMVVMVLSLAAVLIFNASSLDFMNVIHVCLSYLVTFFPVMVLALLIVLFSNFFKSSTAVFFLSILVFIVLKVLDIVFPNLSSLFIVSMFDWYSLWIADSIPIWAIMREFFIMLGYGIMFFVAGFYLFDKKDY